MTELKATPGPWEVDRHGFNVVAGGNTILQTSPHAQARENARLAAAAPELYEALEKSAHALETIARKLDEVAHTPLADILRAGAAEQRAALSKARGEVKP